MNIDENLIEDAITEKTRAIVPVHYAGVGCEMNKIMEIARRHNLKVVEDAAQGVEAQTLANVYLALDHDLDVMPVINKIDLPSAQPDEVVKEIEDVIGIEAEDAPLISAKMGTNIEEVLEQIVQKIPAPQGGPGGQGHIAQLLQPCESGGGSARKIAQLLDAAGAHLA